MGLNSLVKTYPLFRVAQHAVFYVRYVLVARNATKMARNTVTGMWWRTAG